MKLSTAQVQRFWREWAATCRINNWTREAGLTAVQIDGHRKELLARCGFQSLKDVDRVAGFTKVLAELGVAQGTNLQAAREADDGSINDGRVIRNQILTEIVPCLELYIEDVRAYITSIIEDKSRWWKLDRPAREMSIMDLDTRPIFVTDASTGDQKEWPSQLDQIRMTLTARLNTARNDAGDSIHDMKIRAGVKCFCATHCRKKAKVTLPPAVLAALAQAEQEETEPNPF
ncbi:MAG TPA: hypothetical protein VG347_05165 [Verrucomicrobiae bacterium]|nr:hypothetical protein [Verrucomicrobiae bacterium]